MQSNSALGMKDGIQLAIYERASSAEKNSNKENTVTFSNTDYSPNYHHRRLQFMVYNFLERPRQKVAIAYHVFVFALILASLLLSILSSIEEYESRNLVIWTSYGLEIGLVVVFGAEYALRLWSCSAHGTYRGFWGKVRFMRKPYMIIDIIVIIATTIVVILDRGSGIVNISIFRFLRFLQVLRILRLDRQRGAFKIVSQVIYAHRQELLTCWYMSFIILITCSFLVYLAERASPAPDNPNQMQNLADGLYWGVISLLTIGYGDISPQTWTGKLITCVFSLLGTAFFALPAGIIGSGFALQVAQHQRLKHFNKKRNPAAALIQAYWKLYACDPSLSFTATWQSCRISRNKKKMLPKDNFESTTTWSNSSPGVFRSTTPSIYKRRLDTASSTPYIKPLTPNLRHSTVAATMPLATRVRDRCVSVGNLIMDPNSVDESQATVLSLPSTFVTPEESRRNSVSKQNGKVNGDVLRDLTRADKTGIRFIRKVRLAIALRKFKEARRPYDVKDVIEQYTAGQIETFGYIKKLQSRIEIGLGFKDKHDSEIARNNIVGRLNSIETKVDMVEAKMNLLISMIQASNLAASKLEEGQRHAHAGGRGGGGPVSDQKPPKTVKNKRFRVTIHDQGKDRESNGEGEESGRDE